MFPRYNTVDVEDAKIASSRLEELLSQEQVQNTARTKKCSQGAPDKRRYET